MDDIEGSHSLWTEEEAKFRKPPSSLLAHRLTALGSQMDISNSQQPMAKRIRTECDPGTVEGGAEVIALSVPIAQSDIADAPNSHLSGALKSSPVTPTTYRVRGIPLGYSGKEVKVLLRNVLEIDGPQNTVQVKSLAMNLDQKTKTATVEFRTPSANLPTGKGERSFEIFDYETDDDRYDDDDIVPNAPMITIDSHFRGITVLRSFKNPSEHKIE